MVNHDPTDSEIPPSQQPMPLVFGGIEEPAPIQHPAMAIMYTREVQRLIPDLNEEGHRDEAAGLIPTLIDRIVLTLIRQEQGLWSTSKGTWRAFWQSQRTEPSTQAPSMLYRATYMPPNH